MSIDEIQNYLYVHSAITLNSPQRRVGAISRSAFSAASLATAEIDPEGKAAPFIPHGNAHPRQQRRMIPSGIS